MESVGISNMNNGSIPDDILTNLMKTVSGELTLNAHSMPGTIYNIIILMLCVLGIPGNLFVVAVYIRRMTTSTRAYMFALGIADTMICLFYTVIHTVHLGRIGILIGIYVFKASVMFSTLLLAFLATERCLAVAQPHKFTLKVGRAKTALAVIGGVAICYAIIVTAVQVYELKRLHLILTTGFVNVGVLIVLTSYSTMAAILLKRARAASRQVGGIAMTRTRTDGVSSNSAQNATGKPATATQTKAAQAQRGALTLFVVTVVFVLCWLPFFLKAYGLPISAEVKRMYTINSVVNPFIYSFLSPMFRSDVRQFYRDTRARLATCC